MAGAGLAYGIAIALGGSGFIAAFLAGAIFGALASQRSAQALALIRTGARRQTVGFLGWFGPRGLASIVFAVIVVEEAHLPGVATILATT